MTSVNDIQVNLIKIWRRAVGFWITVGSAILLAMCLFLLEQIAVAKVATLAGIILSIATWMSAMMSLCPGCRSSFHEGYAPRVWPRFGCAHCGLGMNAGKDEDFRAR